MNFPQTDKTLIQTLTEATRKKMTAKEVHNQRVSFILATLDDGKTSITQEKVEKELSKLEGAAA
ncbi:hypothetical protein ACGYK4_08180 [Sulfitobacter sp. 1A13368]|uniref:hypothetical protein n=1 Tax=Sulfitobacter sp. 1A13368 TaxID=3368593 RepID=UPI003746673B